VYRGKNYEFVGAIDKRGYILNKLKYFSPQLALFIDKMENGKYQIFSGVETGKCDICGQPLSDPNSLRIGIGPICAKNLGYED